MEGILPDALEEIPDTMDGRNSTRRFGGDTRRDDKPLRKEGLNHLYVDLDHAHHTVAH
jgi:hypothetical protein